MSTERTVTLPTHDHGDVTLPEPSWCVGHPNPRAQYRTDLTHYGPEHRLTFNGHELFRLMLAQAPLSERASRDLAAFVEQSDFSADLDPAGLYDLAAALDHAADELRAFADQLVAILAGGDR